MRVPSKAVLLILLLSILLGGSLGGVAASSLSTSDQVVQFVTPTMVVNTSFLNIRTGPGARYSVLITVVGGTDLPVLGRANDGVWYQVSTVIGVGWVNSEFVIPRGDFTNIPTVAAPPFSSFGSSNPGNTPSIIVLPNAPGQTVASGQGGGAIDAGIDSNGNPIVISGPGERFRAVINVEAVDLRTEPNGRRITTLYRTPNVDYPLVGNARDRNGVEWFAITVPTAGTGWVEAPKVTLRLSGACRTVLTIVAQTVGLGDSDIILTSGNEAYIVNITQDGQFVEIELPGGEVGLVPFNAVVTRTGTTTDNLDINCAAVAVPGTVNGDQGGGVVSNPSAPRLAGSRIIVNTAFLNIRSGPGAQYLPVATVPGGTELAVLGIASDRVWFLIEGTFGRGWVNEEFTIFRGVIDNVPVIQLSAVTGVLSTPQAVISGAVTLYAAPGGTTFGAVGTISGPLEVPVVARTADFVWVQINTSLGFGWVLANQVTIRGDTGLIPVAA